VFRSVSSVPSRKARRTLIALLGAFSLTLPVVTTASHSAALLDLDAARPLAKHDASRLVVPRAPSAEALATMSARWDAQPPIAWSEIALEAIAKYRLNPLRAARLLAHLHAALHDAWLQCAPREDDARCPRIAQHVAAARVMQHFVPAETPGRFMSLAVSALAAMPAASSHQTALEYGAVAAWGAILRSLDDAADRSLEAPSRPPARPGTWRPTPPLFAINPTERGAPLWRTWLLTGGNEVQPPAPLAYGSAAFVAEMREVLDVNRRLSADQKRIADEWNLDLGTASPPGVWNRHAIRIARAHQLDAAATTRLLAALNVAMFDALVACWTAKLRWWSERPVLEVRERLDASFEPYIVTPPFPGYVSGHASASGAAAQVIAARIPAARDEVMAMAAEAALSRLYGGIHVRSDNDEGLRLGLEVGRLVVERLDARTHSISR